MDTEQLSAQVSAKIRKDPEAQYLTGIFKKHNLATKPYIINPFNIFQTNYWMRPIYNHILKNNAINKFPDDVIVAAIAKTFIYIGIINSMINAVNDKLDRLAQEHKNGVDAKSIDRMLDYTIDLSDHNIYMYNVELMANDGEIITLDLSVEGFVNSLLISPTLPFERLSIDMNKQQVMLSQWPQKFKEIMIKKF